MADMTEWEYVGTFEVDSATCAFADADSLGIAFDLRQVPGVIKSDGVVHGIALVKCGTGADLPLPIVVRRSGGTVDVACIRFVTDVDELEADGEGQWEQVGDLDLPSGNCVACDPYCVSSDASYRIEFSLPSGRWTAERFVSRGDVLGLRLVRSKESSG